MENKGILFFFLNKFVSGLLKLILFMLRISDQEYL